MFTPRRAHKMRPSSRHHEFHQINCIVSYQTEKTSVHLAYFGYEQTTQNFAYDCNDQALTR